MADILLYHSVLGLRQVELDLADQWRNAGHNVVTPDLFKGRQAGTYDEGFVILKEIGLQVAADRAIKAAEQAQDGVVLAGVSMGAGMAARAWQQRLDAKGILFISGPGPWPNDVAGTPVQLHAARPEPFDEEEVFEDWQAENPGARLEVYRYDNVGHYFLDPALADFSEAASEQCRERCLKFLSAL
ncbi:Dienelactone hydrolase [Palleronia marisminoris]|uniref:Dienelactone hydrolase family protein n=1 Tax=Palleronia marisminoris TaxID=315423 RepID=A0A1Y5TVG6_9RHOB|nr:dienelactone hydrolase family protein [Palleronia marisminoris]SFH52019.1 Dienelactone hydrolase [Palleronia marisminoris]SLN71116.1 Dienelactone hydrolase family protein [Palleronia marisminoris]